MNLSRFIVERVANFPKSDSAPFSRDLARDWLEMDNKIQTLETELKKLRAGAEPISSPCNHLWAKRTAPHSAMNPHGIYYECSRCKLVSIPD